MSSSLTVRRITADQGAILRELRAASLRDAPDAFDETLEEALSESEETFDAAAQRHADVPPSIFASWPDRLRRSALILLVAALVLAALVVFGGLQW